MRAAALALVAGATLWGGCAGPSASGWRYEVRAGEALDAFDVAVCFPGAPPAELVPGIRRGQGYLAGAWSASGEPLQRTRSGALSLDGVGPGQCIRYRVDASGWMGGRWERHVHREHGALVADPDLLLWRPPDVRPGVRASVRFELHEAHQLSVPWPAQADGSYLLDRTAFDWSSRMAMGELKRVVVPVGGGVLDVSVVPAPVACTPEGVRAWLEGAGRAVSLVYGELPVPRAQVVVLPVPGGRDEPVRGGMALRAGGAGLVLILSDAAEDADLPGEWVGIHELFHLGMPFIAKGDAWLSEGVTMYYSETLQSRGGFISERRAWQLMHEGFERGRRGGHGLSLREESRQMHRNAAYMRVYWGGAFIALGWDLALRKRGSSLDAALRHLRACCMQPPRMWTADELVAELDRWAGEALFSRIAEPILEREAWPSEALEAAYQELGLSVEGETLTLGGGPEARRLRGAITGEEESR